MSDALVFECAIIGSSRRFFFTDPEDIWLPWNPWIVAPPRPWKMGCKSEREIERGGGVE